MVHLWNSSVNWTVGYTDGYDNGKLFKSTNKYVARLTVTVHLVRLNSSKIWISFVTVNSLYNAIWIAYRQKKSGHSNDRRIAHQPESVLFWCSICCFCRCRLELGWGWFFWNSVQLKFISLCFACSPRPSCHWPPQAIHSKSVDDSVIKTIIKFRNQSIFQ